MRSRLSPALRPLPLLALLVSLSLPATGMSQADSTLLSIEPAFIVLSPKPGEAKLLLRSRAADELAVALRIEAAGAAASGGAHSLAPMLTLEATTITLAPGTSRAVVVRASLPPGAADGEYVARIVVGGVGAERSVPVRLRKGDVVADIKLGGFGAVRDGDEVRFSIDLTPLGNAGYHGNLNMAVTSASGKAVRKLHRLVDVYEPERLVIPMEGKDIPPGRYKVRLDFDSDRPDLGAEAIPVLPKKYTVEINMP